MRSTIVLPYLRTEQMRLPCLLHRRS